MTPHRPATASAPAKDLIARIDDLAALFRASAAEADRLTRLPPAVVAKLLDHGLFRIWIPKAFGGLELDLPDALRAYEAASRADGSVGWAVMIGSGGGLFAAYLEEWAARALYARPDAVIAGSGAPDGSAERVTGGYRATGRWRYASGAHYATTFTANCIVTEAASPVLDGEGKPLIRAMSFEASQVKLIPTWDTTGMRGTGSHDFEVKDVFVPEARTFSVYADTPRERGPVYRLPFGVLTELPVACVALGIARHALESFAELARRKKFSGLALGADPFVQSRFAESSADWSQVKAGLEALAAHAWDAAVADRALSVQELAQITAGCATAVARLRAGIHGLIGLTGMTGIQIDDELGRAWRDLQTVAAHSSVSPRQLVDAGAALLSVDA
jgi:alkylation response protein AidB-like acyl-CoA dehydrogenase